MKRVHGLLFLLAWATALAAPAQLPTTQRALDLAANFPELQKNVAPENPTYVRDPFIRRETAPPAMEANYTDLLIRLQTKELERAAADSDLAAARAREQLRQTDVNNATIRLDLANSYFDNATKSLPPGDSGRAQAQQEIDQATVALQKATTQLDIAQKDRANAAKTADSAQGVFDALAQQELGARNQRKDAAKDDLGDGSVLGMLVQRNLIVVRFRDDQDIPIIQEVLRRYDLQVVSGIARISLFNLQMGRPAHLPESDLEHVLRLNRTVDALSNEPSVFSAVQEVMLDAVMSNPTAVPADTGRPCWAWYDGITDGKTSATLIRLPEAWSFLNANRADASASVPVVVLDEGFPDHADLTSLTPLCALQNGSHGNQVAGILNGTSGNGKVTPPAAPVSAISTCSLTPVSVLSVRTNAASFSSIKNSLASLLDNYKPRIVNVSLNYNWRKRLNKVASTNTGIKRIVTAQGGTFRDLLAPYKDSVVIVSAAGNDCDGATCTEPAVWTSPINWALLGPEKGSATPQSTNVIVVQAVVSDGSIWLFSNRQGSLAAPGQNLNTCAEGTNVVTDNGTSLAAPIVSGVVAMMLAVYPALKPAVVLSILGAGPQTKTVDAFAAVQGAQQQIAHDAADLNGDGVVDWADFSILRAHMMQTQAVAALTNKTADLNGDGVLSLKAKHKVLGFDSPMTDLEVMKAVWQDPTVPASDLDGLIPP